MYQPPAPSLRIVLSLVTFACLILLQPVSALGQSSPSVLTDPKTSRTSDPIDQEQFVSYWTTETGWRSELHLSNNLVGEDLTVTPFLRTADGSETRLGAVTIKPQEVNTIDIETAIGSSAPQLIATYGSMVLRYHSPSPANLYAVTMIRNIGHPFAFHIDAMGQAQEYDVGSREGVWWLPTDTASDYLVLTNQGTNVLPVQLSLYDASGKESKQSVVLAPRSMIRYSVRQLIRTAKMTGSFGGIKVFAPAHAGSLDTLHVLFDESASFSAILKMFDHNPSATIKERDHAKTGAWTLRAPMLALSNPDPALAFPQGTVLQPQLFVRNTTRKMVDVNLRFNWRTDSASGKAAGPAFRLGPFETRRIDVAALQDGNMLPKAGQWTSVILSTNGLPDEVMAVAASYDATLRYGAQTPFSDQLSRKWAGGHWEYDPQHDSIVTAGNGGASPIQAAFTIYYNQGTQKYELEQTLQPDEQMWIDVGKLFREHVRDKNGNTLPADLTSGSYDVRDLTHKGAGTLFEGKVIYDKTYGHVAYGCTICCGIKSAFFLNSPLGWPEGFTYPQIVNERDGCTNQIFDGTSDFYGWSTANAAIATVNSSGVHTGVSVGSTTSSATAELEYFNVRANCPLTPFNPGGNDNVMRVDFIQTSAIPVNSTGNITATIVNPPPTIPTITLTLTGAGGSAVFFSNNLATRTITASTSLVIKGVQAGSVNLTATVSNSDGKNPTVGFTSFTVGATPFATITLKFRGSKSSGDNLSFSQVAQTCQPNLGLYDCTGSFPATWVWNAEVSGSVSDDASKWTVAQGVVGLTKGYYRDTSGVLQSFSTPTNKPAPLDNPPSAVLQQVTGQKLIFWLDAPGRGNLFAQGEPIDSMTDVKNFTSSICSTVIPGDCATMNWYVKIVVKPGGVLDLTNSQAGLGSLSLNF